MKNEDLVPPERIAELRSMAQGLYGTITGLTDAPYEALIVIEMLHLILWMNNRQDGFDVKLMLEDYNKSFVENFEANEALAKGKMN